MNRCERCRKPCRRRWCSQACNALDRRAGKDLACEQCGEPFYLRPTDEAKGGGRFCSNPCRRRFEAEHAVEYPKIGKVRIHRIVAAEMLGRPLRPGEVVHHLDGNRKNFAPENLEIWPSHGAHMRAHHAELSREQAAVLASRRRH